MLHLLPQKKLGRSQCFLSSAGAPSGRPRERAPGKFGLGRMAAWAQLGRAIFIYVAGAGKTEKGKGGEENSCFRAPLLPQLLALLIAQKSLLSQATEPASIANV